MGSSYFLTIAKLGEDSVETTLAYTYGDFDEVNFIAKRRIKEMTADKSGADFRVELAEVSGVAGDAVRDVTKFTGDADVAALVLKKKLASERKEQSETPAPAMGETTEDTTAPANDDQNDNPFGN